MNDLEAAIRDRALRTEGYPFSPIINEFTRHLPIKDFKQQTIGWNKPTPDRLLVRAINSRI